MKKSILRITIVFTLLCTFFACQKELSVENGGFSGVAQGTLLDSSGNCKNIIVSGSYVVDSTLGDSNYIKLSVNFTSQGKYQISSDTVNGIWFLDSGFALNTGSILVKVKGKGKPLLPKSSDFLINFNGNTCSFTITATGSVSSGGSGGGTGGSGTGGDYFPTTSGSAWTYQYLPKLGSVDTFRVTAAASTIDIDSLTYSKFGTSLGDTFYYAKNASIGNYYTYSTVDFDYTFLFDSVPGFYIHYPILKERANVGDSWESGEYGTVKLATNTGGFEYGKAKIVFTIISKNTATYTIGGKTYENVINVKREIKFMPNNGTYRTVLTGNTYFAKGYGMIDQVLGSSPNTQSISLVRTPSIR